jgi:DNA (cytosine-5)-methyltransferase 1
MRYLSLFAGIEAATVAWHGLGWTPVAFAEIDGMPCDLLASKFPHVPNLGDVSNITDAQIAALGPIDVVIGGSPCQDLSVAGKRGGLEGERSSLFHEQVRIFHAARTLCGARWCVWENVPGAFSSNRGRDFAAVVGTLAGCGIEVPREGWGCEGVALGENGLVEWGMLDAQWFGLAQRRDRVFAVLDTGDWADRPPVLLEPESLRGDSAPRRETGQRVAAGTLRCTQGGSDVNHARAGHLISDVAPPLTGAGNGTGGDRPPGTQVDTCECLIPERARALTTETLLVTHALRADGFDASEDGTGRGTPLVPVAIAFDLSNVTSPDNRSNPQPGAPCHALHKTSDTVIAYPINADALRGEGSALTPSADAEGRVRQTGKGDAAPLVAFADVADPVAANQAKTYTRDGSGNFRMSNVAHTSMQVRRLTPRECERLQGFPDDWTLIDRKGKPAADGPRYKALGNSMAVPVITWIGQRIERAHRWTE